VGVAGGGILLFGVGSTLMTGLGLFGITTGIGYILDQMIRFRLERDIYLQQVGKKLFKL
jgi:hypothetical protein